MATCWRSVTPCVILLHRPSGPMAPVLSIQGVIKMAAEGFYWREAVYPPYFDFSTEKFMFKRTWQVVFWGTRNYFRCPKTTCRSPEGSGWALLRSRCAWKRKIRNQNLKNNRNNIYSLSLKNDHNWKGNGLYSCFQSIANRIFSSSDTMSRDLFSVTAPLVHDVRYIFAGLLWWIFFYFLSFNGNMTREISPFVYSVWLPP